MERIAHTTSSTDTLGPRPALPEQHAERQPIPHDLHIPTAPPAPHTLTRRQVQQQLAMVEMYDDAWGRPNAWNAFGDGAQ